MEKSKDSDCISIHIMYYLSYYISMNNNLKLLFYILLIAIALYYVQDRFGIFEIYFGDGSEKRNAAMYLDEPEEEVVVGEDENYVEIFVGEGEIIRVDVELADNDIKRMQGLSNRKYLGDYDGMLFIFDQNVNNPFWMKDMLISLDIMFIDESGFIIEIMENMEPCVNQYSCPAVAPTQMYKYVLEVNEGFSKINGVKEGQNITMYLATTN